MKWHADIIPVDNGFIVDYFSGDGKRKVIYEEKNEFAQDPDKEHIVEMFYEILEFFGEQGSRYDKKRIHIELVKGDKCE